MPGVHAHQQKKSWPVLKWMGAIAAVISFILGVDQLVNLIQKYRLHHGEFAEAMNAGAQQMQRADYAAAFASYEQAVKLDPNDRSAHEHELQVAMLWLEDMQGSFATLAQVADKLLPVFDAAIPKAKPAQAADFLAHEAWANFLRVQAGTADESSVGLTLQRALSLDPANVYTHAVAGFWILWQGGKLPDAKQHFDAALATGKVRGYVRELQLDALEHFSRPDNDAEMVRVADAMRKGGETISEGHKGKILTLYFFALHHHTQLIALLSLLPAADARATFDWLMQGRDEQWQQAQRDFIGATIIETSGDRAGALARFKALRKALPENSSLLNEVDDSVRRLSR